MDFTAALSPLIAVGMSLVFGIFCTTVGFADMANQDKKSGGIPNTLIYGICEVIGGSFTVLNGYGLSIPALDTPNLLIAIWFSVGICTALLVLSAVRFFQTKEWMPSLLIVLPGVLTLKTLEIFLAIIRNRPT